MRRADELLCRYATYHRDRRNIATHFVGVPMIVLAICILLSRPAVPVGTGVMGQALALTPALGVFALASLWYLTRGQLLLGAITSALIGLMVLVAAPLAAAGTATWLGTGLGLFALGWLIQFAGHWYEGRKPAFVDDLVGLLVGPMFVVAEALFALGWNRPLQRLIEIEAGPTVLRDLSAIRP
jgi:uncharacterized membrane protein YGL010W